MNAESKDAVRARLLARCAGLGERTGRPFKRAPGQEGSVGPHENREAGMMLRGEKPIALFSSMDSPAKLRLLKEAAQAGLLGCIEQSQGPGKPAIYVFHQPDKQAEAQEVMQLVTGGHPSRKPSYWDMNHTRIGELLGYSKTDIDAFSEHHDRLKQEALAAGHLPQGTGQALKPAEPR